MSYYYSDSSLKRTLTKTKNLLCLVCKSLEKKQLLGQIVQETQAVDLASFWRKEKSAYAKREAKENQRRQALAKREADKLRAEKLKMSGRAKLTREEAIALGLEKKDPPQKPEKPKKAKKKRKQTYEPYYD